MSENDPPVPVRTRFAPSPTGLLHIGGLRTALYNWLFARKHGGTVVLRIEDTDRARYVAEAENDIVESLAWAGLDYDEGPGKGGPFAPYHQSERGEVYRRYAQQLVDAGHAYYAFDTPEEIEAMRGEGGATKYDVVTRRTLTNSLTLPGSEVERRLADGEEHVIRLKVQPGETVRFEDTIRGPVAVDTAEVDDQVLIKSDGMPTYHLANVVDDHLMEITHVVRGEEWLPSVPKHILLYRYLGWEPPQMAHLPLILSPSGGKLSKRHADKMGIPINVRDYRDAGYEPEALVNFLAFLGWNPGTEQELFSLEDLVEAYSIERTSHSGAQFNLDKLDWYNGQYIRMKPVVDLIETTRPHLDEAGIEYEEDTLRSAVELMQERITFAREIATEARYFFEDPDEYDPQGLKKRWKADSAELIREYANHIQRHTYDLNKIISICNNALYFDRRTLDRLIKNYIKIHRLEDRVTDKLIDDMNDFLQLREIPSDYLEAGIGANLYRYSASNLEKILKRVSRELHVKSAEIIHPTRLATTGTVKGPSLYHMLEAIGKDNVIRRIHTAVSRLN